MSSYSPASPRFMSSEPRRSVCQGSSARPGSTWLYGCVAHTWRALDRLSPTQLRTLIKTLADQLRPLHDTSRRHAAQIEEVSSGINVLAELLRFTNRSRTQTLADALGSV